MFLDAFIFLKNCIGEYSTFALCTLSGLVREPSGRNMRHMLASVILRLLGNRVVHEDADLSFSPLQSSQSKMEFESPLETPSADLCGESLFDRLLLVLHGLLSNKQPIWLKSRSSSKLMNDFSGDSPGLDREVLESLQVCSLMICCLHKKKSCFCKCLFFSFLFFFKVATFRYV